MENVDIEKLIEELGSPNPKYWIKARYELAKCGKEVTDYLIKSLKHDDPLVRGRIARLLGEIGDAKAVHSLVKLLKTDRDIYVCSSIAKALGMLGDKTASGVLVEKLEARESKVRKEAVKSLGDLNDKGIIQNIRKYYEKSTDEERVWATYCLIKLGEKELIHLLEDNLKEEILISAITVSGALKLKESVPLLLEFLQTSASTNIKIEAIKALAEIGGKEITEEINKLYEKSSGQERVWFIYALARMRDRSKVNLIIDLLKKEVHKSSVLALGEIGDKSSSSVILENLKNNNKKVRYEAVRALEKLKDENSLKALKEALDEEKENYIKLAIDEAICQLEKGEIL